MSRSVTGSSSASPSPGCIVCAPTTHAPAPRASAGVRVPGYPWTPALFVAAAGLVVVSAMLGNPRNAAVGTGLLLLGIPVYLWWRRPGWAADGAAVVDPKHGRRR